MMVEDFPLTVIPVFGDPEAIALAVTNLLGNAVKYTPAGGRVTARIEARGGGAVEFSVVDTGIGIGPEDLPAVTSGFYRAEAGKKAAGGYGIGLKVTRELLEAHGAALQAESSPGKGSRFYFALPVWRGEDTAAGGR